MALLQKWMSKAEFSFGHDYTRDGVITLGSFASQKYLAQDEKHGSSMLGKGIQKLLVYGTVINKL